MRAYIFRRLLMLPVMLVVLSFLLYLLLYIMPGNAALAVVGGFNEQVRAEEFEKQLGLDRPWYVQYGDWLGHAVRGDFGDSLKPPRRSVGGQIKDRIPATLTVGLLTIVISTVLGIAIGIISAVRRNSPLDYGLRVSAITGISVPDFWTGTLLVVLPAVWWQWTPIEQTYVRFTENPLVNIRILIWPALILAIGSTAYIARIVRSSMLETLYSDHVRTARAKGLQERVVILRHAFRGSLVTLLTVIGLRFATILGGTVIAEQIFGVPGMGSLTFDAVLTSDYILLMGVMTVFFAVFQFITLATDILYTVVDPRIRY